MNTGSEKEALCFIQAGSLCLAMTAWGLSSHVQGGDPT